MLLEAFLPMCLQPPVLILLRVLREGLSSIPCPMGIAVPSLFACPFPLKPCVSCPRWRSALHLQPCSPSLLSLSSNPTQVSVHPAATLITLGSVVLPTAQSSSRAGRRGAGDRHRELVWEWGRHRDKGSCNRRIMEVGKEP